LVGESYVEGQIGWKYVEDRANKYTVYALRWRRRVLENRSPSFKVAEQLIPSDSNSLLISEKTKSVLPLKIEFTQLKETILFWIGLSSDLN
jgi:hypothetical protein